MKVWETWWTSRSHVDLDMATLGIGLRIMSLTAAAPEQDGETRYCLRADGAPLSLTALARECRCTVGKLSKAIGSLVAVGTMVCRDDGAIGFAQWDEYQLSPRALRMKRQTSGKVPPERPDPLPEKGLQEVRGQRSEKNKQTPPPPREISVAREGQAVALVARLREAWHLRLAEIRSELAQPMDPTADAQGYGGMLGALELHGVHRVLEVVEHSVRAANEHHVSDGKSGIEPAKVAAMFRGQGFGAHLAAWDKAERRRRGSAMQPPHTLEWSGTSRMLTDAEQRWWRAEASGGVHRGALEVELRKRWQGEADRKAQEADEIGEWVKL